MPRLVKKLIKRCFQVVAANLGRHRFSLADEPGLLVLMYHRILPADDPRSRYEEPGMTVTPESFDIHLAALKQHFELLPLDDWIKRKQTGSKVPDRACAITFDDGWADNYEYAWPLLQEHGVPATIFLVSDFIGTNAMFWPERLARLLVHISENSPQHWQHAALQWIPRTGTDYSFGDTAPDREQLSAIIGQCKHLTDDEIHDRIDRALDQLGIEISSGSPSMLDWDQVREMAGSGLVDFGSHTCTHARLNDALPEAGIRHQVTDSKTSLEDRLGTRVDLFCFPNGDYTEDTLELVVSNYNAAVTTSSGWNVESSDNFRLRRVGVHQDIAHDRTAFLARISGWM